MSQPTVLRITILAIVSLGGCSKREVGVPPSAEYSETAATNPAPATTSTQGVSAEPITDKGSAPIETNVSNNEPSKKTGTDAVVAILTDLGVEAGACDETLKGGAAEWIAADISEQQGACVLFANAVFQDRSEEKLRAMSQVLLEAMTEVRSTPREDNTWNNFEWMFAIVKQTGKEQFESHVNQQILLKSR